MALRKILARDIIIQVESSVANTWFQVEGLNSATPNPGEDAEDTDITDFQSGGRPESMPTQRGASLGMEGFKILDSITGDAAPGQGRCELVADTLGYNGQNRVRFRQPLETVWTLWPAAVFTPGEIGGGGNNDAGGWNMTIKRSGASTTAAVV